MALNPPDFVSDRLLLRRFTHEDAVFVRELHANPDLLRFIPSAAMTDPADADAWIERTSDEARAGRGWWCVTLHDGTPVGAVLLKPVRYSNGRRGDEIEIGWRWHPAYTGRGYATEAGELLLRAGHDGGLARIIAVVDPQNAASRSVCHRIGMRAIGRSHRYYDSELDVFEALAGTAASR